MPNITNIVYVTYQSLTAKFKQDFYIDSVKEKGFDVEYWNLSDIYHQNLIINSALNESIVKNFSSLKQVEEEILRVKYKTLFIFNINYYGEVYTLFRLFSKHKCITAFFARGAIPFPFLNESLLKKTFSKINAFSDLKFLKKAFSNQLAALARRLKLIHPFTYVFYAGKRGLSTIGYGGENNLDKSILIPVNSFDFDKSITIKHTDENLIDQRYCVFLDAYLPFHPDFDLVHMPKVNAETYYNSLNNFFDYIERVINLKVVIAAHPRSDYEKKRFYKNRRIIKYKTGELIKHSEFVLTHASTSVSFAIIFKKPVVFIYGNDIKKTYPHGMYLQILHFANVLNTTCVNIDESEHELKIPDVDEKAYRNYKYNFLASSESEHELTENIFKNFLTAL